MTQRDYTPVAVDASLEDDCRQLIRLATREDIDRSIDWTTACLIDPEIRGCCEVVARQSGVCAGLITAQWVISELDADLTCEPILSDGDHLVVGEPLMRVAGNARDLLTCERVILNLLSRLCGVASLTRRYADAIEGTACRLYDTRKTTPGWRRLEKYAVRCGGGHNHRTGLFDGFLVKDNHLALAGGVDGNGRPLPLSPSLAVRAARKWAGGQFDLMVAPAIVEIEVDSLAQLADVLPSHPDIVLLDNFSLSDLLRAVELRNAQAPDIELEASGNVNLTTIREIAATGVERISSGALTHQAVWIDLAMDWVNDSAS